MQVTVRYAETGTDAGPWAVRADYGFGMIVRRFATEAEALANREAVAAELAGLLNLAEA